MNAFNYHSVYLILILFQDTNMDKNGKSHGQSPVIMMSPDGAFMHLTNPTTVKQSSLSLLNCSRDKERSHRPVKPVHPPTVCSYGSSGAAVSGACQPFFSNIQIEKQLSGQHCIYVTPDTISIQSNQKPFKLKKRRRNSDSSSSDSDDETANLLKVYLIKYFFVNVGDQYS